MTLSPIALTLMGLLLAASSALVAGAVTWGAFREQLSRQREEIHDLRDEVRALARTVNDLTLRLAVVADRHDREHS